MGLQLSVKAVSMRILLKMISKRRKIRRKKEPPRGFCGIPSHRWQSVAKTTIKKEIMQHASSSHAAQAICHSNIEGFYRIQTKILTHTLREITKTLQTHPQEAREA